MLIATPALASTTIQPGMAYVKARAASIGGDHGQAAELYAALARASADKALINKAVAEAISAGNMPLALQLIGTNPAATTAIDAKLLLVADALRRKQPNDAIRVLGSGESDLGFWVPLVQAWNAAERGDANAAATALAAVPKTSPLSAFVDEEKALILLKLGRTAEAAPFAQTALEKAGPREYRLRMALAAGFAAAGDKPRALSLVQEFNGDREAAVQALNSGKLAGVRVDTAAKAFAEQLVALALEMRRANPRGAPVSVLQVARYAAPESSSAAIMLAAMLNSADRTEDALAVLRTVQRGDPFYSDALDAQVRALGDAERLDEALSLAQAGVQRGDARSEDFGRLGDVLSAMERHEQAAAAYQRAVALGGGLKPDQLWPLLLLQASALESADKWPQAKAVLQQALRVAPDQAPVLNFLGYAQLERGEDLEAAEAMIRRAVALAPDDASITDSLGWALFKRGRTDEAIQLLEQAAKGDPTQAEIHEHLGDAYFTAGRRFEARFAWSAALATAEEEDAGRLRSKVASGLTPATAAR